MKKIYIISLLVVSVSTAYSYSLFSGAGLGEPIETWNARARGMGGVFKFSSFTDLTYECSALFESVDSDGKAENVDFTLPYFKFWLPLPKMTAIDVELNQILNLDFDVESQWEEFGEDSVQRRVRGRGSASVGRVGVCKTLAPLTIEAGGFVVFGSSTEEWTTDFGGMTDVHDTEGMEFSGAGGMGLVGVELWKFDLSVGYFSNSDLSLKTRLPQRFKASVFFSPLDRVRLAGGISRWGWEEPFDPMARISVGGEMDVRTVTLRAGFHTGNWYFEIPEYGAIRETVGSAGIGISLKSLCQMDLSVEYGKRGNSLFEENVWRVGITFQGRETL
jgi:hypothetical protein